MLTGWYVIRRRVDLSFCRLEKLRRRTEMKRLTRLVTIVVATLLIVSVGPFTGRTVARAPQTQGVTKNSILIGTSLPLSGLAAAYGVIAGGSKAYFDYVNAHGGVH